MALGALNLPTVNTAFTGTSTALAPYNPPIIGQTTTMSPMDSMLETFNNINDGIDNLGKIFSDKISGLNSHLAFRLETISKTLEVISSNIVTMGLNQQKMTDIEDEKFDEFKENEAADDRSESLGTDVGDSSKGIIATLKESFSSFQQSISDFFGKVLPDSDLGKVGFYGAIATLILTQLDKFSGFFTEAFKFIDEKVMPKVKAFVGFIKEDIGPIFDNILKFFKEAFSGLGDLLKGAFEGDAGLFLSGVKQVFVDLPIRLVSIIGDAFFSLVDAALKTFGIDAPFIGDIKIAFRTLPEAIDKAISDIINFFVGGFNEIKDTFTEKGLISAIGVGFRQFYDNTVGLALNLLYDMTGAILKLFGAEKLGEFFANADFTTDGIKNAFTSVVNGIKGAFNKLVDGMKGMANAIIDKINILLPERFEIKKFDLETPTVVESADGTSFLPLKDVENLETSPALADNLMKKEQAATQEFNETYVYKIVKENNLMKEKTKEMKEVTTVKGSPNILNQVIDNKTITGGSQTNNTKVVSSSERVDHTDRTAAALIEVYA